MIGILIGGVHIKMNQTKCSCRVGEQECCHGWQEIARASSEKNMTVINSQQPCDNLIDPL